VASLVGDFADILIANGLGESRLVHRVLGSSTATGNDRSGGVAAPSVVAVIDVTGVRDDPSRRGRAEVRLNELFPDRSGSGSLGRPGLGPDRGRAARAGETGEADVSGSDTRRSGIGELESQQWDTGHVDEPDPFTVGGHRLDESTAAMSVRAQRGGRFRRLAALARIGHWRIDPERRGAVAVMAAILVAALAVGWQALASRPQAEPVSDPTASSSPVAGSRNSASATTRAGAASSATGTAVSSTSSASGKVIVDVVGRVHRPGLVTLLAGARVADAVRAAGGALAGTNLSSLNLARVCVDGEQIAVGVAGAAAPAGTSGSAPASGAPVGLVNLNTATADQLDALPGVGPVMAQRIIAYRTDHGPFTAVTQLQQVSGIGDAKYADLSPLVTV
jgi:competence protein ComEA